MEFCHLKTVEVMKALRDYMDAYPNGQYMSKLQKIMDEYTERPQTFLWMHVYVKGYISNWRLSKGALFIFSSQDEDSLPNKIYVEQKWLSAYKNIKTSNPDVKLTPMYTTNTIRDFIEMVYQKCV